MLLLNVSLFIYNFLIFINGGISMKEITKEFMSMVTSIGIVSDGYSGGFPELVPIEQRHIDDYICRGNSSEATANFVSNRKFI